MATELEVFRFVHHAHTPAADFTDDAVMGNRLPTGWDEVDTAGNLRLTLGGGQTIEVLLRDSRPAARHVQFDCIGVLTSHLELLDTHSQVEGSHFNRTSGFGNCL